MKTTAFINLFIIALLSQALGLTSVFMVQGSVQETFSSPDFEGELGFGEPLETDGLQNTRLNGRDGFSLLPGSSATVNYEEESHHVNVELSHGTVFFATEAGDFTLSVQAPFARVDSITSSAAVTLDSGTQELKIYALEHPSRITFTQSGEDLNALLVPTGAFMNVAQSKVSPTLARLRLTKLSKEFPFFSFEESKLSQDIQNVWQKQREDYKQNSIMVLANLQKNSDFGPALKGFKSLVHKTYQGFKKLLTVLPSAETYQAEKTKENSLLYAMSNLLFDDRAAGEQWLSNWKTSSPERQRIMALHTSLFFVLPGDELYPVKEAASDLLFTGEDALEGLRRQFQEIESLLETGALIEAETAYRDYQERFDTALQSDVLDDPDRLGDISREYFLIELLLRKHSVFYTAEATQLLTDLEEKILAISGTERDVDEERQAFVQSKLRFLENLFSFVMDRKISIEEATDLAYELVAEAQKHLGSIQADVAVRDHFEAKLEEYDLFVQFMNSPEFYTYSSFEEGLEDYRKKVADLESLNQYIQSIRTGEETASTLSLEDATAQVEEDLHNHAIQFSEVRSLGDNAHRLFEVLGAHTGGYSFEANYDRQTQILYDVAVGDLQFSTGITLESAKTVIVQAVEGKTEETEGDEESSVSNEGETSLTEQVAIRRAQEAFEAVTLDADDFTFEVLDLTKNTFTFTGFIGSQNIPVSGIFDLDTGLASEIIWEWEGTPQTVADVSISQLEGAVQEAYNTHL